MALKSFYRTYRPQVFDDVVGQEHIVTTLKNALKTNRVSHAYLFCGPRGTGKTTLAKILAKAVNCTDEEHAPCGQCNHCLEIGTGVFPDVIEIDAASNNGVDEIRDLIEKVKYAPLEGKMKVYIIDEVHMLSQGAFNALLKTLEEPPEHVIFVLATTEAHKVLPTIVSRCQRFDFKRISMEKLSQHLEKILTKENIRFEDGVCELIASLSDGGVRDALTILEQCVTYSQEEIKVSDVYEMNGVTTPEERYDLLVSIQSGNMSEVYKKVTALEQKNIDIQRLINDLIELLKDAAIFTFGRNDNYVKPMDLEVIKKITSNTNVRKLMELSDILIDTLDKARYTNNLTSYFELSLIKMTELETDYLVDNNRVSENIKDVMTVNKKKKESVEQKNKEKEIEETKETPIIEDRPIEKRSEETIKKIENIVMPSFEVIEIVSYMLSANKEEKQEDQASFKNIDMLSMDAKWTQICNFLKNSQVVLSGKAFTFIAVDYESRANQINEFKGKLVEFSEKLFGKRKYIYAITKEEFSKAVEQYKTLLAANQLPEAKQIDAPDLNIETIEVTKKDELPEGIYSLFGDDIDIE